MASCNPCPAPCPISVNVKMTSISPSSKQCSRTASRASVGSAKGKPASASCSRQSVPNYMKPLSRTPSYTGRVQNGSGDMCCPGHPRPDCCLVPCPEPCLPRCPLGIYVERVESMKPDRKYEPPEVRFDGVSTYRDHYFLKCGDKAKSFKPFATFVPSDAPLDGISTYREAFHCKPLKPVQKPPWAVHARFDPSCAPMEGVSQYRFDYKGCMAPPPASFKPHSTFVPSDGKLEGVSTYRLNYIPYCPREYDYARPKQSARPVGAPSCAPMEGVSTYRYDYHPKCLVRTNSLKPKTKPRFSDARMAGVTTYKNDFIPFHFEKCPGPCIPALIYDGMPKPCMFGCSGDGDKVDAQSECNDPCPPNPGCCEPMPCGRPKGEPYPCDIGTAGKQIQQCCDCLNDPPLKDDPEDC